MLSDQACGYYSRGYNCAEAMLLAINEVYALGLTEASIKLVSGFGGGMGKQMACGAMTGAIAGLGQLLVETKSKGTPGFSAICAAWVDAFTADLGSDQCSDLMPRYKTGTEGCLETVRLTALSFERFAQQHHLQS